MSPDLFNLYSEIILRNLDGNIGIALDGLTVNNLRYADIQRLLDIVVCEIEDQGLSLNAKKTVSMVISGKEVIPTCNIKIHNE